MKMKEKKDEVAKPFGESSSTPASVPEATDYNKEREQVKLENAIHEFRSILKNICQP
tara:strand:+ start:2736 stop:2906 length:171 start_codon:yes stop_codon:yes gene_type:complete